MTDLQSIHASMEAKWMGLKIEVASGVIIQWKKIALGVRQFAQGVYII